MVVIWTTGTAATVYMCSHLCSGKHPVSHGTLVWAGKIRILMFSLYGLQPKSRWKSPPCARDFRTEFYRNGSIVIERTPI